MYVHRYNVCVYIFVVVRKLHTHPWIHCIEMKVAGTCTDYQMGINIQRGGLKCLYHFQIIMKV